MPAEISDVAARALSDDPGSAAELLDGLESAIASVDHTTMLEPAAAAPTQALDVGRRPSFEDPADSDDEDYEDYEEEDPEEAARHRKIFLIGLGVVGVLVISLCIALGVWVTRIFGDVGPLDKINIGIGLPTQSSGGDAAKPGSPAKIVQATVFPRARMPINPARRAWPWMATLPHRGSQIRTPTPTPSRCCSSPAWVCCWIYSPRVR